MTHNATTEAERKALLQEYLAAYNGHDVDGMVALLHPDVRFRNVADGTVNAATEGIDAFRELAEQSAHLFSDRHQEAVQWKMGHDKDIVCVAFTATLAVDLPNGLKAGETLMLEGRSEFRFEAGRIIAIDDFS